MTPTFAGIVSVFSFHSPVIPISKSLYFLMFSAVLMETFYQMELKSHLLAGYFFIIIYQYCLVCFVVCVCPSVCACLGWSSLSIVNNLLVHTISVVPLFSTVLLQSHKSLLAQLGCLMLPFY